MINANYKAVPSVSLYVDNNHYNSSFVSTCHHSVAFDYVAMQYSRIKSDIIEAGYKGILPPVFRHTLSVLDVLSVTIPHCTVAL